MGKLRFLQRKLLSSFDAKLYAVRQVTTLNEGRNSPSNSPSNSAANTSSFKRRTDPGYYKKLRKPKTEDRKTPSLYLTNTSREELVRDKAKQVLTLLALEPEWEARFEPNSYGYRPGRKRQDAIGAVFTNLRNQKGQKNFHKFALSTEISKCSDQIDHDYLLSKLNSVPEVTRQIKTWLEAGIMKDSVKNDCYDTPCNELGTCLISPFLVNVALHGMETTLKNWVATQPSYNPSKSSLTQVGKRQALAVIRFADEFVLIHRSKDLLAGAKEVIATWLADGPGLKMNEEMTDIVDSNNGFTFLGFSCITVRTHGVPRVKMYPSRSSQVSLLSEVRNIIQTHKAASAYSLICRLKPVIIGWANEYKYVECSEVFGTISNKIFQKLRAWVFRRDPRNSRTTIKERYFPAGKEYFYDGTKHLDNWVLVGSQKGKDGKKKENFLPYMSWIHSSMWVKVRGQASVYDDDALYWADRTLNTKGSMSQRKLLQRQGGKCNWCNQLFTYRDVWEVDHIQPKSEGGSDTYDNLQLLHKCCHVKKTAKDKLKKTAQESSESFKSGSVAKHELSPSGRSKANTSSPFSEEDSGDSV